ncbi:MAG: hypothetical protein VKJ06_04355 [Vampirovibrionales bacterium]|nr:hypothetical protein [Vampirovibrionales bacterium]
MSENISDAKLGTLKVGNQTQVTTAKGQKVLVNTADHESVFAKQNGDETLVSVFSSDDKAKICHTKPSRELSIQGKKGNTKVYAALKPDEQKKLYNTFKKTNPNDDSSLTLATMLGGKKQDEDASLDKAQNNSSALQQKVQAMLDTSKHSVPFQNEKGLNKVQQQFEQGKLSLPEAEAKAKQLETKKVGLLGGALRGASLGVVRNEGTQEGLDSMAGDMAGSMVSGLGVNALVIAGASKLSKGASGKKKLLLAGTVGIGSSIASGVRTWQDSLANDGKVDAAEGWNIALQAGSGFIGGAAGTLLGAHAGSKWGLLGAAGADVALGNGLGLGSLAVSNQIAGRDNLLEGWEQTVAASTAGSLVGTGIGVASNHFSGKAPESNSEVNNRDGVTVPEGSFDDKPQASPSSDSTPIKTGAWTEQETKEIEASTKRLEELNERLRNRNKSSLNDADTVSDPWDGAEPSKSSPDVKTPKPEASAPKLLPPAGELRLNGREPLLSALTKADPKSATSALKINPTFDLSTQEGRAAAYLSVLKDVDPSDSSKPPTSGKLSQAGDALVEIARNEGNTNEEIRTLLTKAKDYYERAGKLAQNEQTIPGAQSGGSDLEAPANNDIAAQNLKKARELKRLLNEPVEWQNDPKQAQLEPTTIDVPYEEIPGNVLEASNAQVERIQATPDAAFGADEADTVIAQLEQAHAKQHALQEGKRIAGLPEQTQQNLLKRAQQQSPEKNLRTVADLIREVSEPKSNEAGQALLPGAPSLMTSRSLVQELSNDLAVKLRQGQLSPQKAIELSGALIRRAESRPAYRIADSDLLPVRQLQADAIQAKLGELEAQARANGPKTRSLPPAQWDKPMLNSAIDQFIAAQEAKLKLSPSDPTATKAIADAEAFKRKLNHANLNAANDSSALALTESDHATLQALIDHKREARNVNVTEKLNQEIDHLRSIERYGSPDPARATALEPGVLDAPTLHGYLDAFIGAKEAQRTAGVDVPQANLAIQQAKAFQDKLILATGDEAAIQELIKRLKSDIEPSRNPQINRQSSTTHKQNILELINLAEATQTAIIKNEPRPIADVDTLLEQSGLAKAAAQQPVPEANWSQVPDAERPKVFQDGYNTPGPNVIQDWWKNRGNKPAEVATAKDTPPADVSDATPKALPEKQGFNWRNPFGWNKKQAPAVAPESTPPTPEPSTESASTYEAPNPWDDAPPASDPTIPVNAEVVSETVPSTATASESDLPQLPPAAGLDWSRLRNPWQTVKNDIQATTATLRGLGDSELGFIERNRQNALALDAAGAPKAAEAVVTESSAEPAPANVEPAPTAEPVPQAAPSASRFPEGYQASGKSGKAMLALDKALKIQADGISMMPSLRLTKNYEAASKGLTKLGVNLSADELSAAAKKNQLSEVIFNELYAKKYPQATTEINNSGAPSQNIAAEPVKAEPESISVPGTPVADETHTESFQPNTLIGDLLNENKPEQALEVARQALSVETDPQSVDHLNQRIQEANLQIEAQQKVQAEADAKEQEAKQKAQADAAEKAQVAAKQAQTEASEKARLKAPQKTQEAKSHQVSRAQAAEQIYQQLLADFDTKIAEASESGFINKDKIAQDKARFENSMSLDQLKAAVKSPDAFASFVVSQDNDRVNGGRNIFAAYQAILANSQTKIPLPEPVADILVRRLTLSNPTANRADLKQLLMQDANLTPETLEQYFKKYVNSIESSEDGIAWKASEGGSRSIYEMNSLDESPANVL